QSMVIEYARNELALADAHSTEFDPTTANPVVATMAEQAAIVSGQGDLGGTMRLGSYDHTLVAGSLAARTYGTTTVSERHRHRRAIPVHR
ncbi:MAG: CTP synthase, partial [Bowdeniella nasicola]|nr:CTP synthase [Bowdeniella nasicola]